MTDLTLVAGDFAAAQQQRQLSGLIVLERDFTIRGGHVSRTTLLDLNYVRSKVLLRGRLTLALQNLFLVNPRRGSATQQPGFDLLTAVRDPYGNVPIVEMRSSELVYRYCFPAEVGREALKNIIRPSEVQGNTAFLMPYPSPYVCTSTAGATTPAAARRAVQQQQPAASSPAPAPGAVAGDMRPYASYGCFKQAALYIDVAVYGGDMDENGIPIANSTRYPVRGLNTTALCRDLLSVACIAKLGPLGCLLYTIAPGMPAPPAPLLPTVGAPAPAAAAAAVRGVRLSTILGCTLGGGAALLVGAAIAGGLVCRRRRRRWGGRWWVDRTTDPESAAAAKGPNGSSTDARTGSASDSGHLASLGGEEGGPRCPPRSSSSLEAPLAAEATGGAVVVVLAAAGLAAHQQQQQQGAPEADPNTATADTARWPPLLLPPLPPLVSGAAAGPTIEEGQVSLLGGGVGATGPPMMTRVVAAPAADSDGVGCPYQGFTATGGSGGCNDGGEQLLATPFKDRDVLVTPLTPLHPEINLELQLDGAEVRLSAVTLGKGAYGRVVEGTYGGRQVAVKILDYGLLYPHQKSSSTCAEEAVVEAANRRPTGWKEGGGNSGVGDAAAAAAVAVAPPLPSTPRCALKAASITADTADADMAAGAVADADAGADTDIDTVAMVAPTRSSIQCDDLGRIMAAAVATAAAMSVLPSVKRVHDGGCGDCCCSIGSGGATAAACPPLILSASQDGLVARGINTCSNPLPVTAAAAAAATASRSQTGIGICWQQESCPEQQAGSVLMETPATTAVAAPRQKKSLRLSPQAARLESSLKQEVEVLARCQHPNIVRLLAACLKPPRFCLVMELMDTSLDRLLYGSQKGAVQLLPLDTVLHIGIQIAQGLSYLHPTIVHRDLKPGNVLISHVEQQGRPVVKLADFGLSRLRDTVLITQNPEVGTAPYIAPEAFDIYNHRITDRVDVYAFGVILWEMLAGKRPWAGQNMVVIALNVAMYRRRLPLDAVPRARCPTKLRCLIESCWERVPERRPASAEVVKRLMLVRQEVTCGGYATESSVTQSLAVKPQRQLPHQQQQLPPPRQLQQLQQLPHQQQQLPPPWQLQQLQQQLPPPITVKDHD